MCTPFSWTHHGVESYVLEDESINGLSSARQSSRSCPFEEFLSLHQWTSFSDALMKDCCRRRCFRGGRDVPALWRQRFPDAFPGFNVVRILRTILVIFHGRLGRCEVHFYRSSPPSCAILNRNSPSTNYQNSFGNGPEYSMMALVVGDNFEFFSQFDWSNSPRKCTFSSELMDVHQWNKVDFPCCGCMCRCMTCFHSLSTAAFASGINIAWATRSLIHPSRFPSACVSERQISRIV